LRRVSHAACDGACVGWREATCPRHRGLCGASGEDAVRIVAYSAPPAHPRAGFGLSPTPRARKDTHMHVSPAAVLTSSVESRYARGGLRRQSRRSRHARQAAAMLMSSSFQPLLQQPLYPLVDSALANPDGGSHIGDRPPIGDGLRAPRRPRVPAQNHGRVLEHVYTAVYFLYLSKIVFRLIILYLYR
jgi:hypothetical protein